MNLLLRTAFFSSPGLQAGVNRPQTRFTGRFNGLPRLVFRHGLRRAEACAGKPAEAG